MTDNTKFLAPWSVSKLKAIKNCGAKFWFDYVYKAFSGKKHPEEKVKSEVLELGSKLHEIFENAMKFKKKKIIIDSFNLESERFPKIMEYKFGMENLYDRIDAFMVSQPNAKLYLERGWGTDFTGKEYTFFSNDSLFRTRMDIMIEYINPKNGNKSCKIIDIKSGKYYEQQTLEQLRIYAAAVKLIRPDIKVITYQAALINQNIEDMVLTPKVVFDSEDPAEVIKEAIDKYVVELPNDLNKLIKEKKYFATKDFMCKGCSKKKWCPKFGGTPLPIESDGSVF